MKHENVIVGDRYGNENYMVKFTPNKENPEPMFKIGDQDRKGGIHFKIFKRRQERRTVFDSRV